MSVASDAFVTSPAVVEANERVTRNAAKLTIVAHKRANYTSCFFFSFIMIVVVVVGVFFSPKPRPPPLPKTSLPSSVAKPHCSSGHRCAFLLLLPLVSSRLKRFPGHTTKTPGELAGAGMARMKARDCV